MYSLLSRAKDSHPLFTLSVCRPLLPTGTSSHNINRKFSQGLNQSTLPHTLPVHTHHSSDTDLYYTHHGEHDPAAAMYSVRQTRSKYLLSLQERILLLHDLPNSRLANPPGHRLLCTALSKFDMSSRPSELHMLAILFPDSTNKPKLVWLPTKWIDELNPETIYQVPETQAFLKGLPDIVPIMHNPILGRDVSDILQVCYRDTFGIDGSQPNRSVVPITATRLRQCHGWRGPMLAYAMVGSYVDPNTCKDISMHDFHHVVDYIRSYKYKPTEAELEEEITHRGEISG